MGTAVQWKQDLERSVSMYERHGMGVELLRSVFPLVITVAV